MMVSIIISMDLTLLFVSESLVLEIVSESTSKCDYETAFSSVSNPLS